MSEGHKFVKVKASSDTPHPDSPMIELRSLPHIPSWMEARLDSEVHHQEFRRHHTAYTHVVTVPIPVVEEWKRRIAQLEQEIRAHGLRFEAVISNPGDPWMATPGEPATLYGKPLFFPDESELIGSLMEPRQQVFKTKARPGMSYQMQEQELAAMLDEQGEGLQIEPVEGTDKVRFYLMESAHIPSCPVVGKQAPETIDLSEESI
ncbi:hypothetical protein Ahp2_75 [Aeromonas phage Ahp2]|nr:hypothetical protein Ahp2_75 [Aeromonas phage Ahp2]